MFSAALILCKCVCVGGGGGILQLLRRQTSGTHPILTIADYAAFLHLVCS